MGAIGEGARALVSATIDWLVTHTETALAVLGIIAGIFLALSTLRRLFAPLRPGAGAPRTMAGVARRVVAHSKDWFFLALAAHVAGAWFELPQLIARGVAILFTVALIWQVAVWVRALALSLLERRADLAANDGQLASAINVVRLMVTVAIFAIAAILMLDNLGANVTTLVAGLGVGGIAIGLAAQGIFSDLFAALSIIFDRPFGRGDQIEFDGIFGRVDEIGLKTTRVRALSGEEVIVSNANLLGKTLRNHSRLDKRRVTLGLGLTYQTPPDAAAGVPQVLEAIVAERPECVFVRAGLTGFGASSIDYVFIFDVLSADYETMITERHAIITAVLRRFNDLGLDFAYPTQMQLLAAPDGKPVDPRASRAVPA